MAIEQDEQQRVGGIFREAVDAHQRFAASGVNRVVEAARAIRDGLASGHKVIAFGNGGSASDAEHVVAELVGRFESDRPALAAIALTADSSVVTSIANDYGYDRVFSRQIEGLGRRGDIALGISTSGRSANVAAALVAAKTAGLFTIALTGRDGGTIGAGADVHINVAEQSTARVQEVHRTILHAICALIER
jgi:phosphoheptose isomerase